MSDAYQLDAPYVPTPDHDVRTMLEIGSVGRDDVVLDLGCGDGRIVIAAARTRGARGVGIDIDPDKVALARQAADEAGVSDLVRFVRGDLRDADFSEATVVMLYLLRHVNLELRPRLLRDLRPGARVVSRHFDMGDWQPDVQVGPLSNRGYCWKVPPEPASSGASCASSK